MCGILGVHLFGEKTKKSMKAAVMFAYNGLLFCEERGYDASGVASIGDETKLYKNGKTAFNLSQNKSFWEVFENPFKNLICHTRASTNGKPEENENNHPFDVGGIVGCHNGTFTNPVSVLDKLKIKKIADVDSIVFYQTLNELGSNGSDESVGNYSKIKEAIEMFDGTAALMWSYKSYPDDLYCFVQGRPLNWFFLYDYNMILFLSDRYHLLKTIKQIEINSKINGNNQHIKYESFPSWDDLDTGMFYHFGKNTIHEPVEISLRKCEERSSNTSYKMGYCT